MTAREHLRTLVRGGSPTHPIRVSSPAVIEPRCIATPCAQCGGEYRVIEHTRPIAPLRRVDVECRHCSTPSTLWFTLVPSNEPN